MTQRTGSLLLLLLAGVAGFPRLSQANVTAQEGKGAQEKPKSEQSGPEVVRDPSGVVNVKCERGVKVSVGNRTTGPIVVVGWDRDFVEASAISDRGVEVVRVNIDPDPSGDEIALKADYAETEQDRARPGLEIRAMRQSLRERRLALGLRDSESAKGIGSASPDTQPSVKADVPGNPTPPIPPLSFPQEPDWSPMKNSWRREIFLEVKVPRYAEIELIRVFRSEVLVSGVETAVQVNGEKSAIMLRRVGAAEVKTTSGDVIVEEAIGLVDVITTSGAIVVKNSKSDVRAVSLNGRIEVQCARGRVDVSNTDGPITLTGVGGDASATATYSHVRFSGPIRADGRYYLKSMSGVVEMEAPANSPGFTATISSYRGGVETDFPLKTRQQSAVKTGNQDSPPSNRRLIGRHGNGQAQITLDSFDGNVRLKKTPAGVVNDCK